MDWISSQSEKVIVTWSSAAVPVTAIEAASTPLNTIAVSLFLFIYISPLSFFCFHSFFYHLRAAKLPAFSLCKMFLCLILFSFCTAALFQQLKPF